MEKRKVKVGYIEGSDIRYDSEEITILSELDELILRALDDNETYLNEKYEEINLHFNRKNLTEEEYNKLVSMYKELEEYKKDE